MKCRNNANQSLAVTVLIHHRELGFIRGKICDIAAHGMCVDMRPVALPEDTVVELALVIPGDAQDRVFRLTAMVAHAADGVMGLVFLSPGDPNVRGLLRAIAMAVLETEQEPEAAQREQVRRTAGSPSMLWNAPY
jgi:hypothetical protein